VGINTVVADDPLLTARPDKGKQPTRVVLDSHLRIPLDCKLLATAKDTPLLIITSRQACQINPQLVEGITKKGAEVLACPNTEGQSNLHFVLDELSKRGVAQLLVEGGPTVISSFLKENLADEICVYISPKILGGCGSVDISKPMAELTTGFGLYHVDIKRLGDDVRITGLAKGALSELGL
jgi:diaminohydroxyphosphoribosylaminopyrimidine deaminase/5-amino-6-(5-phosphoribosylamino)uracil reductase